VSGICQSFEQAGDLRGVCGCLDGAAKSER
jgi:hypothetical protein